MADAVDIIAFLYKHYTESGKKSALASLRDAADGELRQVETQERILSDAMQELSSRWFQLGPLAKQRYASYYRCWQGLRGRAKRLNEIAGLWKRSGGSSNIIIRSSRRLEDFLMQEYGCGVIGLKYIPYVIMEIKTGELEGVIRELRGNRHVEHAHVESIRSCHGYFVRHAAMQDELWNLRNIGAYDARGVADGAGVKVGVIDTGIDYTHKELSGRFSDYTGANFVDESDDPMDDNGHGTHVSGTIAGIGTGIATGCQLIAYKVLNADGYGSEGDCLRALEQCVDDNVSVVNMSLGTTQASKAEKELCDFLLSKGILICAAAGNEGYGDSYPAAYSSVVSVAAVDRRNNHADFSNVCDTLDISGPGVDVYSSVPGNSYAEYSGTSMACPHATGSLALALSANSLGAREAWKKMRASALKLGDSTMYGSGLIQVQLLAASQLRENARVYCGV